VLVVFLGGRHLLLECGFDDRAEEYADHYEVYRLPDDFVPPEGSWESLVIPATKRLGSISVREVEFDVTRRRFVRRESIGRFAGP
jgi:hypothetical protein